MKYQVTDAPTGIGNPLYKLAKTVVKASNLKKSMEGTKEQVLANAAAANAKNRHFVMPADSKAHYTDHIMLGAYHCLSDRQHTHTHSIAELESLLTGH